MIPTPDQTIIINWLVSTLTPVLETNNPQSSAAQCVAYATQLSNFYVLYILPNLQVNLTTGAVNFVVPSGS